MAIDEFAVYNTFEIKLKKKYSRAKARLFFPLVLLFDRMGLNANGVSFLGFFAAFLFWVFAAVFGHEAWAFACMAISVLLDNLDGSLAEYQGPSEIGPVVDNFYDMTALFCVVAGVTRLAGLNPAAGLLFWLLYVGIIGGSFVLSSNGIKAFVARLRIVVYLGYLIVFLFGPVLDLTVWVGVAILVEAISLGTISRAWAIHRRTLRYPDILSRLSGVDIGLGLLSLLLVILAGIGTGIRGWA